MSNLISAVAEETFMAVEKGEFRAAIACALDAQTFKGKDFHAYTTEGNVRLGISLKTMQNRMSIAKKMLTKHAAVFTQHTECTVDALRAMQDFVQTDMARAGAYVHTLEDIGRYLRGAMPLKAERLAEAVRVEEAREAKRIADELKAAKDAQDKAEREADQSGTVNAVNPDPVLAGATVGKADESAERNPAPSADIVPAVPVAPVAPVGPSSDYLKGWHESCDRFAFVVERGEEGGLILDGMENLETAELSMLVKTLNAEIKSRKAELAELVKKAA